MTMVPAPQSTMMPANGTATMTETAEGRSLSVSAETNQAALAAQATAQVQARYVMADRRPRNWLDVRTKLLNECKRPGFAKKARYRKPVGGGSSVEGPSVRFAEACLRYAGNMSCDTIPVYEDRTKRMLVVSAIDYETNAAQSSTITIAKTVERKDSNQRVVLGSRLNSSGGTVYIVEATDDELLNKQNALVSKTKRGNILSLVPQDIIDDCMEQCIRTTTSARAEDPTRAQKEMVDAYGTLGILASDIERYLGHPIASMNAKEADEMETLYVTIRDGETTWAAVMENKFGERKDDSRPGVATQTKNVADRVSRQNAARRTGANTQTGEPPHEPKGDTREPGEEG